MIIYIHKACKASGVGVCVCVCLCVCVYLCVCVHVCMRRAQVHACIGTYHRLGQYSTIELHLSAFLPGVFCHFHSGLFMLKCSL